MIRSTFKPAVIISLDTVISPVSIDQGIKEIQKIGITLNKVTTVEGHYKNNKELSYFVHNPSSQEIFGLIGLAWGYNQESILHLDNQRFATFYNIDHVGNVKEQYAGKWKGTCKGAALQAGNYTFDKTTNRYYIIQ